jgi:hypothetical protein
VDVVIHAAGTRTLADLGPLSAVPVASLAAEDAWLNEPADAAEAEGREGSVSLAEMAALLRADQS